MSFIRFTFWRFLRQPKKGDVFDWRDGSPFDRPRVIVLEVREGWVRIKRSYATDEIEIRTLLAFYRKVSP